MTIGEQELKHDRSKWWLSESANEYRAKCQKCGYTTQVRVIRTMTTGRYLPPLCRNCGEKMTVFLGLLT